MNDSRVPEIMASTDEDKKRYGSSAIGNSLILARNLFRADAGTRFILVSHGGWDHHSNIYTGTRSHTVLMRELDVSFTNLIKDLDDTPSKHTSGKTLLDETLVICMGEFGRTPGPISETRKGREHYIQAHAGYSRAAASSAGRSSARPTKWLRRWSTRAGPVAARSTWRTLPAQSTRRWGLIGQSGLTARLQGARSTT